MSWSYTDAQAFDKQDIVRIEPQPQREPGDVAVAAQEQINAARAAAALLAHAVGRPGWQVGVNMVGHANPDHGSYTGWGEEFITITVRAVPR